MKVCRENRRRQWQRVLTPSSHRLDRDQRAVRYSVSPCVHTSCPKKPDKGLCTGHKEAAKRGAAGVGVALRQRVAPPSGLLNTHTNTLSLRENRTENTRRKRGNGSAPGISHKMWMRVSLFMCACGQTVRDNVGREPPRDFPRR